MLICLKKIPIQQQLAVYSAFFKRVLKKSNKYDQTLVTNQYLLMSNLMLQK